MNWQTRIDAYRTAVDETPDLFAPYGWSALRALFPEAVSHEGGEFLFDQEKVPPEVAPPWAVRFLEDCIRLGDNGLPPRNSMPMYGRIQLVGFLTPLQHFGTGDTHDGGREGAWGELWAELLRISEDAHTLMTFCTDDPEWYMRLGGPCHPDLLGFTPGLAGSASNVVDRFRTLYWVVEFMNGDVSPRYLAMRARWDKLATASRAAWFGPESKVPWHPFGFLNCGLMREVVNAPSIALDRWRLR